MRRRVWRLNIVISLVIQQRILLLRRLTIFAGLVTFSILLLVGLLGSASSHIRQILIDLLGTDKPGEAFAGRSFWSSTQLASCQCGSLILNWFCALSKDIIDARSAGAIRLYAHWSFIWHHIEPVGVEPWKLLIADASTFQVIELGYL